MTFISHCCKNITPHFTPLSPLYSFFKTSNFSNQYFDNRGDGVIGVISKENQHFLNIGGGRNFYFQKPHKSFKKAIGVVLEIMEIEMTEEGFWDKFNRKHNPQFYEKIKKKKTSHTNTAKRHPVFKVSN